MLAFGYFDHIHLNKFDLLDYCDVKYILSISSLIIQKYIPNYKDNFIVYKKFTIKSNYLITKSKEFLVQNYFLSTTKLFRIYYQWELNNLTDLAITMK